MDRIETSRIILRRFHENDFESMRILESDPLVMKFTPSRIPQTPAQTRTRLESQISKQNTFSPFGIWAAETKLDSSFVGWFMLMPIENAQLELGFMIVQPHWGKGLATEISRALLDFARTKQNITGIIAKTNLDNTASIRVLTKLGFEESGTLMAPETLSGGEVKLRLFRLFFTKVILP